MNPLPIEYQKMQSTLHERIDNVLSVNPTKIKKFKNGSVKVNQYLIQIFTRLWDYPKMRVTGRLSAPIGS